MIETVEGNINTHIASISERFQAASAEESIRLGDILTADDAAALEHAGAVLFVVASVGGAFGVSDSDILRMAAAMEEVTALALAIRETR